jgi:ferric-dicitrate binding protein FerR (iron transport regulator)
MNKERLQELAKKYLDGTATEAEKEALHSWYDTANDEELEMVFINRNETTEHIQDRILVGIKQKMITGQGEFDQQEEKPSVPMIKRKRPAVWLAAAAVTGIIAFGAWFFMYQYNNTQPLANKEKATPAPQQHDVQPGSDKARLQLADGTVMVLEEVKDGDIQTANGITIKKQNGQLVYDASASTQNGGVSYNMITTPRGGQYHVVLPDGSKVWLNASSTLRFPTAFEGKERRVQLTGEAYFEVAKNRNMPFIATTNNTEIEVLGTHFNVNAYSDEDAIRTTLLEGSVKVGNRQSAIANNQSTAKRNSVILKPGEQAVVTGNSPLTIDHSPDIEEAIAWKNGMFQFNETGIPAIMRQVSRWYNVEIAYEGALPNRYFSGEIPRNVSLSKMLQLLELSDVHYRMEGNRIIVMH